MGTSPSPFFDVLVLGFVGFKVSLVVAFVFGLSELVGADSVGEEGAAADEEGCHCGMKVEEEEYARDVRRDTRFQK